MPEESSIADAIMDNLDLKPSQDADIEPEGDESEEPEAEAQEEEVEASEADEAPEEESGEESEGEGEVEEGVETLSLEQLQSLLDAEKVAREEAEKARDGLYGNYKNEQQRRKEIDGQMQSVMQTLQQQLEAEKAEQESVALPDKDEDPVGYVSALINQSNQTNEQRWAAFEEQQKQQQQHAFLGQMAQVASQAEEVTRNQYPDYDDALNHYRDVRAKMARLENPGVTDKQIQQYIYNRDTKLVLEAVRDGKNPAQLVWEAALEMGYSPKNGDKSKSEKEKEEKPKPAPSLSTVSGKAGRSASGTKVTKQTFSEMDKTNPLWQKIVANEELLDELEIKGEVRV